MICPGDMYYLSSPIWGGEKYLLIISSSNVRTDCTCGVKKCQTVTYIYDVESILLWDHVFSDLTSIGWKRVPL
jgi:hypothetical protein